MRQYFLTDGTKYSIPYSLEDLRALKLQPNTLIWYRGLTKWTEAQDVEELYDLFPPIPPPFAAENEDENIFIINLLLSAVGSYCAVVGYSGWFMLPAAALSVLGFVQTKSSSRLHKTRLLLPFLSLILGLTWAGFILQVCLMPHQIRKAVANF
jgi:GYF domain 2